MSEIGSGVRSFVTNQLELRKKINNREVPDLTIDQQISISNSNTAWIRLSSAVNIDGAARSRQFGSRGKALAQNNVLFGGTNSGGTYQDYKVDSSRAQQGQRPRPGIIDASIKFKNRFGTLRTATVNFECWTLEDLNKLEVLYMRPGYTVLLEYGNSIYGYKDGKGNANYQSNPPYITDFFTRAYDKNTLYAEIDRRKERSGGNYDALYGFIKNYSWSLRPDGGYNCTTEIITIGEIVESLKMSYGRYDTEASSSQAIAIANAAQQSQSWLDALTPEQQEVWKANQRVVNQLNNRTAIHTALTKISDIIYTRGTSNPVYYQSYVLTDQELIDITGDISDLSSWDIRRMKNVIWWKFEEGSPDTLGDGLDVGIHKQYIKLGLLNHIINQQLLYARKDVPLMRIRTDMKNSQFLTTPVNFASNKSLHFSVNPYICLLPTWGTKLGVPPNAAVGRLSNLELALRGYAFNTTAVPAKPLFHTNEIMVEMGYVKNLLHTLLDENIEGSNAVDVFTFYKKLLTDIKAAAGSINELELAHWEGDEFDIADRNFIGKSGRPKIDLVGLKSLVKQFSLQSKLSPRITTQIAISAQANSSAINDDATAFGALNIGLIDRIMSYRQGRQDVATTQAAVDIENAQAVQAQWAQNRLQELRRAVNVIQQNITSGFLGGIPQGGTIGEAYDFASAQTKYAEFLRNEISGTELADGDRSRAIIPFELTLSIQGISGIRVAETFDISSEVLPSVYRYNNGKSRVAFIVVGVDHSIRNGEWITNLRAQTIHN